MTDSTQNLTTPALPTGDARELGFSPQALQTMRNAIAREIDQGTLPGAVIMLGRHGKVAMLEAFGKQDPASDVAMSADSVFRIYSMTKPVVSLAIMMLMEEGRIALYENLSQYIPEFAKLEVVIKKGDGMELVPAAREITIADLLKHTAGFAPHATQPGYVQKMYAEAGMARRDQTNEEHAARLATMPLVCHPGDEWNYSRSTDILGCIIEIISGQTLGEFLKIRILGPLQMHDTGFHIDAERGKGRLAQPFEIDPFDGSTITPYDMTEKPIFEAAGSGLVSTAPDYARFLQMLTNGGSLNGVRLIGSKTLSFMASDHLADNVKVVSPMMPPGYGFGLGFAVRKYTGMAPYPGTVGDYFWNGAYGTQFLVDPTENMWATFLMQAPGPRFHIRVMIRNLVYAALES